MEQIWPNRLRKVAFKDIAMVTNIHEGMRDSRTFQNFNVFLEPNFGAFSKRKNSRKTDSSSKFQYQFIRTL